MKSILVWDLVTRLLHWALAASVSAALLIALVVDDHSPFFQFHMLFGLLAAFFVAARCIWGVIGTKPARFTGFPLGASALVGYLRSLLQRNGPRVAGHNPAAAWVTIIMFGLVALLLVTGIGFGGEQLEEVHGVLAYTLLAVIGLHLAGLVWHSVRNQENIAASMVTGRKLCDSGEVIGSGRPVWALGLLAGSAAWVAALFSNYDPKTATVRIPVVGAVVQLGEHSSEKHDSGKSAGRHDDDDD